MNPWCMVVAPREKGLVVNALVAIVEPSPVMRESLKRHITKPAFENGSDGYSLPVAKMGH